MSEFREALSRRIGRPVANASFAMLRGYVRSARRRGVSMLHTARSFSHYRKIFFDAEARKSLLERLQGRVQLPEPSVDEDYIRVQLAPLARLAIPPADNLPDSGGNLEDSTRCHAESICCLAASGLAARS